MSDKTLSNENVSQAKAATSDLKLYGDGDLFVLLSKASSESEGWMKITKAMQTPTGVVIQVTTQQKNPDGSYSLAEALTTVEGVKLCLDGDVPALVPIGYITGIQKIWRDKHYPEAFPPDNNDVMPSTCGTCQFMSKRSKSVYVCDAGDGLLNERRVCRTTVSCAYWSKRES